MFTQMMQQNKNNSVQHKKKTEKPPRRIGEHGSKAEKKEIKTLAIHWMEIVNLSFKTFHDLFLVFFCWDWMKYKPANNKI